MQDTRRDIVDQVLDFVGEINDPTARDTANRTLNRVMGLIWAKHPWRQFWMPAPFTFSTVAGQRAYPLPAYFGRVVSKQGVIRNLSTAAELYPQTPDDIERADPTAGTPAETLGNPQGYTIGGSVGVDKQPTSGEAVSVASSDAADIDVVVSVSGLDAAGAWTSREQTLNGTSAVALGTWQKIITFGKAFTTAVEDNPTTFASSRGTVTLSGASTGTLQALQPKESAVEHLELVLYPTPAASGHVIAVPMLRAVQRLTSDADVLPAGWGPAVFEEMLIQWRVFSGEIPSDDRVARPRFLDLVALDAGRVPMPERKRGWVG